MVAPWIARKSLVKACRTSLSPSKVSEENCIHLRVPVFLSPLAGSIQGKRGSDAKAALDLKTKLPVRCSPDSEI